MMEGDGQTQSARRPGLMAEKLEREKQAEPPFWQQSPEARGRELLRDIAVAAFLTVLASAIGVTWILSEE